MKILGLYDGHNANAALIEDGCIIRAVEEERFSRQKNHDGRFPGNSGPIESVRFCLEEMANAEDVDLIAVALEDPVELAFKAYKSYIADALKRHPLRLHFMTKKQTRIYEMYGVEAGYHALPEISQRMRIGKIKRMLNELNLEHVPLVFVNHHLAHNAAAYYTSGREKGLAISLDGRGDDLCAMVAVCNNGVIEKKSNINFINSIAHFYSAITVALGFKPNRHEGKITGLASYGPPDASLLKKYRELVTYRDGTIETEMADGVLIGPYPDDAYLDYSRKIEEISKGYSRETVAASAQCVLEEVVVQWVEYWVNKTNEKDLFLSGGVFANVKLNQKIAGIHNVASVYVYPGMSDCGLGIGCALSAYHSMRDKMNIPYKYQRLESIYMGPSYDDVEMESVLRRSELSFTRPERMAEVVAALLAQNKIVARFDGALEHGPRALGNRSILYPTTDPKINDWLNKKLKRTEFMPFAPVTLAEYAHECYLPYDNDCDVSIASKYMTITCDCTEKMKKQSPACVHVDGTARPQILKEIDNPEYYKILKEYHRRTGIPSLVNTSFNMHEEPIVCTPEDAVRAFLLGSLDALILGPFLIIKQ